jgi:hypothetical protein
MLLCLFLLGMLENQCAKQCQFGPMCQTKITSALFCLFLLGTLEKSVPNNTYLGQCANKDNQHTLLFVLAWHTGKKRA